MKLKEFNFNEISVRGYQYSWMIKKLLVDL